MIQVPDGIRLHMVAVYLTELESVVDDQVQELIQKCMPYTFNPSYQRTNPPIVSPYFSHKSTG